jgi:hypothetical protein
MQLLQVPFDEQFSPLVGSLVVYTFGLFRYTGVTWNAGRLRITLNALDQHRSLG